jgi:FkbM family methyltransferase
MSVAERCKAAVLARISERAQVPVKYWFSRLSGTLEPEMRLLPLLVSSGDRVIDVGGNYGAYAYRLDRLGARVDVFEPNPTCTRVLDRWAATRPRVRIHGVALSATAGAATLAVPTGSDGVVHSAAGSIEPRDLGRAQCSTVAMRTLDSFGLYDAVLIKIDVEGHEASVIEGATASIAASAPALIVEIEQRHSPVPIETRFDRIASLGYRGYFLRDGSLRPLAEFIPARHQSIEAATRTRAAYHNNFLFLADRHIAAGRYATLLR